jgi:PAS domain S-box-containing protein
MQRPPSDRVALSDVSITAALAQQSPRAPNWQAEAEAMQPLAQQMARDPESLLQTLVDLALDLCQAGTAGVSLLESTPECAEIFRWVVIAGVLAPHVGGSTPRHFSPCGVCLDRGTPQLFSYPERYFTYFQEANTPIVEELVLPLVTDSDAIGTIWIMTHDAQRHFDAEDVRVMTNLANFTAAALHLRQRTTQELLAANLTLEAEISDRQQAEAALRASEEHLLKTTEAAQIGTWQWNLKTNEVVWSLLMKKLLGCESIPGPNSHEDWVALLNEEDRRCMEAGLPDWIQAGKDVDFEYRVKIPGTNETRWLRSIGRVECDRQGQPEIMQGVAIDITDRKLAEQTQRESEEKYRSLFESIDRGFCLLEILFDSTETAYDYRFLEVNAAFEAQSGLSDAAGKTILELVPNLEPQWAEQYGRVAKSGEAVRFEADVTSMDRVFDIYAFPSGALGQHLVAVLFADITDRKHREEQLRRAAELDAFRVTLADALRPLTHPVEIQATAGRVLGKYLGATRVVYFEIRGTDYVVERDYVNGSTPLSGSYPIDSFSAKVLEAHRTGRTIAVSDVAADPDLSPVQKAAYAAIQIAAHIDIPLVKGSEFVAGLAIHASEPREWTPDEITLSEEVAERTWAAVERARAEAALHESELQRVREHAAREQDRQRAETLAELDRTKTLFFSNISHEFRTPITLILGQLEEALARLEDNPQPEPIHPSSVLREQLQIAHRNSLRLLKLVNTLLDFSRIEADCLQAHYEPTDLSTYTTELASVFRSAIEAANLHLVVDCPPLPEPIYVDRGMWEKIVLNLLSNAFKFTFTGTITVSLKPQANQVELTVSDTGIGIPAADLPHLFERFYQVKGVRGRSYEGSGIGLSLVQELVQRHSGTITVNSTVNQGSSFIVTLPTGSTHLPTDQIGIPTDLISALNSTESYLAEASHWISEIEEFSSDVVLDLAGSRIDLATERSQRQLQPSSILIVDDNADMRSYLVRLLQSHYEVITANDGRAALDAIAQQKPDLVLSDVMMPRRDGLQLLRSLRENPQTQDIPILLLSARAGEASQIEGLAAGADDYLIKPFSARELLARVDANLKLATMRREVATQALMMQTVQTLNERLEKRVAERTSQLQDLNTELEAFAYSVSHDLKKPLRYISSFAKQLQDLLDAEATHAEASWLSTLNIIRQSVLAAENIVDSLLEFSRTGRVEMRSTLVPMDRLVQQVQELLRSEMVGRTIHWQIDPLPTVRGDPTLLQLVLQNLLSNAIKYTRDRPEAEIGIHSRETETEFMIAVQDNGAGFDMKYRDLLFNLFQRLHPQEAFPGTGVGLANVRRIIHRHGGRTWAEGEIDRGATFYFSLPKREGPP